MMKSVIAFAFIIVIAPFTFAQEHHQPHEPLQACSALDRTVCAHLMASSEFTTETEGQFMIHVISQRPQDEISEIALELWMNMGHGHGHGSAPVVIEARGANKFFIKNAWFVMSGTWLVRMNFVLNGIHHQIEIPVSIQR